MLFMSAVEILIKNEEKKEIGWFFLIKIQWHVHREFFKCKTVFLDPF